MTPATAHTQRLRTPVTPIRPTFCENELCGNEFMRPPIRVPSPSARKPRARSCSVKGVSVISPRAMNMPDDLMKMMTCTTASVSMDGRSKVGQPKCIGSTRSNHRASARPRKLTRPTASAITKPNKMPSRTLILAMKPRTNRVIIRMNTSTAKDVPR